MRRQTKTRETRKKFLIVCEGEKTEVNYFKAFDVPKKIEVTVRGEGKNSLSLVNKAIQIIDNLKKDDSFDPDRGTSKLKSLCSIKYRHRLQKKISHIYHI
ncbi:RloB domain-containing protein [Microcystis aeruginosa]|uniref:RloB domain-containing protein n=1 Tax=Microcystis aeruginosa TaxID=1126 RepID=UPI0020B13204|nr:RloB domain-containing protein [Microcystis aeruginosa]